MFDDWFNKRFKNSTPKRRVTSFKVEVDEEGNPVFKPLDSQTHLLSDEGSLDTVTLDVDAFFHCGCNAKTNPAGGRCGEPGCPHISCAKCFSRCLICAKPLCLEHAYFVERENGEKACLCKAHFQDQGRRKLIRKSIRSLLKPFIEFEDKGKDL